MEYWDYPQMDIKLVLCSLKDSKSHNKSYKSWDQAFPVNPKYSLTFLNQIKTVKNFRKSSKWLRSSVMSECLQKSSQIVLKIKLFMV